MVFFIIISYLIKWADPDTTVIILQYTANVVTNVIAICIEYLLHFTRTVHTDQSLSECSYPNTIFLVFINVTDRQIFSTHNRNRCENILCDIIAEQTIITSTNP